MWANEASMLQLIGPNQRRGRRAAGNQHEQAEEGAGKAHEKPWQKGIVRVADHRQLPARRRPRQPRPAVTCQHNQCDDVGQPRLDAGQRHRDRGIDQRKADRSAAKRAIRWSSGVAVSLVTERIIRFPAAFDLQTDLIRGAYGDFTRLYEPALTDTVLMKAGIGDDPDAAFLNSNDGRAQRAGHLDALIATKIEFSEELRRHDG